MTIQEYENRKSEYEAIIKKLESLLNKMSGKLDFIIPSIRTKYMTLLNQNGEEDQSKGGYVNTFIYEASPYEYKFYHTANVLYGAQASLSQKLSQAREQITYCNSQIQSLKEEEERKKKEEAERKRREIAKAAQEAQLNAQNQQTKSAPVYTTYK